VSGKLEVVIGGRYPCDQSHQMYTYTKEGLEKRKPLPGSLFFLNMEIIFDISV